MGKRYSDVTGSTLPTFEKLRQRAGLMLYETTVDDTNGILEIKMPRDRIYVFVDDVSTPNTCQKISELIVLIHIRPAT